MIPETETRECRWLYYRTHASRVAAKVKLRFAAVRCQTKQPVHYCSTAQPKCRRFQEISPWNMIFWNGAVKIIICCQSDFVLKRHNQTADSVRGKKQKCSENVGGPILCEYDSCIEKFGTLLSRHATYTIGTCYRRKGHYTTEGVNKNRWHYKQGDRRKFATSVANEWRATISVSSALVPVLCYITCS